MKTTQSFPSLDPSASDDRERGPRAEKKSPQARALGVIHSTYYMAGRKRSSRVPTPTRARFHRYNNSLILPLSVAERAGPKRGRLKPSV